MIPPMTSDASFLAFLNLLARVGAVLVACTGAAVITGWLLHIGLLKSLLPGLVSMKYNTACGLLG